MGKAIEKVNPGRKRSRFRKEFKLEAVRLLELGEKPATQLEAELGIRRNQLHKWQEQMRSKGVENAFRGPGAKPLSDSLNRRRADPAVIITRTQAVAKHKKSYNLATADFTTDQLGVWCA